MTRAEQILIEVIQETENNNDSAATRKVMQYSKDVLTSRKIDLAKDLIEVFRKHFTRDTEVRTGEEASHIVIVLSMTKWCERDRNMTCRKDLKKDLGDHVTRVAGTLEARKVLARL